MNYRLKSTIESLIEPVLMIVIMVGIALGIEINYGLFSISILTLMFLLFFQKRKKEKQMRINRDKIKKQWGVEHKDKRDFSYIKNLYIFSLEKGEPYFNIDNITWRDLNMDSVFSKIDHTMSLPGMQYLYNMLRKPIFERDILRKRNEVVNLLLDNKDMSQSIQYPLFLLGKKEGKDIFTYFEDGIDVDTRPLTVYRILSYLPYLTIVLFLIKSPYTLLVLIGIITLNTIAYQLNKKKIYEKMETFRYLGNLLECAEHIMKLDTNAIDLDQEQIKGLLTEMKIVMKNITKINYNEKLNSDAEIFIHYFNMVTLKEPKIFYKTINLMNKYKRELFEVYTMVGKIDAYISIASYKDGLDYCTEPDFEEYGSKFYLNTEELYHPLLDNPVSYSLELNNKGALVTGSNASGKSTFLRTVGVNSIFAQTLNLALAKNYSSSYFKLLTSIGTTDSIVEGDSYFMAEAKSLKRIINMLDPNQPVLCILDEIFRGTNTAERISAALESLNYMIEKNCCVIAATHDLELTNLVNDRYDNYHFKETIETNDIKFDYILRSGPCTTRNAIIILKYLGYPLEIYENATRGAVEYLKEL